MNMHSHFSNYGYMSIFAGAVLSLFALVFGLLLIESALYLSWGGAQSAAESDFNWRAHEGPVTRISKNIYSSNYSGDTFAVMKSTGVVRIFIVGESCADLFGRSNSNLKMRLEKQIPGCDFEIINCATSGYDSSRILVIANEIMKYSPDIMLVFMGNNIFASGSGPRFYSDKYLNNNVYRTLYKRSWLLQKYVHPLLTDNSDVPADGNAREQRVIFREDYQKIITLARQRNVGVVLFTLPVNVRDYPPVGACIPFSVREYFTARFLCGKQKPAEMAKNLLYLSRKKQYANNAKVCFYLAHAYDDMRQYDMANRYFRNTIAYEKKIRSDTATNDAIRSLAKENETFFIDVEKIFSSISERGMPGNSLFQDHCHWFEACNDMIIGKMISVIRDFKRINSRCPASGVKSADCISDNVDYSVIKDRCKNEEIKRCAELFYLNGIFYSQYCYFDDIDQSIYFLSRVYKNNPRLLEKTIDSKYSFYGALRWHKEISSRIDFDKKWHNVLFCVGETYRRAGQYSLAIKYFDESINENNEQIHAYLFKGLACYEMKDRVGAKKNWRIVIQKDGAYGWLSGLIED